MLVKLPKLFCRILSGILGPGAYDTNSDLNRFFH
uniref:Uncharacterized protein n=1 Tax=Manihot esculenta TaxID=3983 RepID=A0A2C9VVF4_MANES